MKQNLGEADKAIRVIIGTLLVFWGLYNRNLMGLIGLYPLVTAFVGYCPVAGMVGIDTREKKGRVMAAATSSRRPARKATKKVAKKATKKRRK